MARRSNEPIISFLTQESADKALYTRLAEHIRGLIVDGRFPGGSRLPSTRQMSKDIGCSRNTVIAAFHLLIDEGYIDVRRRSGMFVTANVPDKMLQTRPLNNQIATHWQTRPPRLSASAERILDFHRPRMEKHPAFSRQPDARVFPFDIWAQLFSEVWRNQSNLSVNYQDPMGYMPLREAVADHLATWRGLRPEPDQIMITSGSTHAMHFLAQLLVKPGDSCIVEEPGFLEAKAAILSVGGKLVPACCDEEGINIEEALSEAPHAVAAFVTPSHQHPLGVVMSDARREALLLWSAFSNAWIIEDDHDAEIRHVGRAQAALKSMDWADCVIYVGSFSKSTFQSMRLGYIVLPKRLVQPAQQYRAATEACPPISIQPVMEQFLRRGHFASHLRRARKLYKARKIAFRAYAEEILPDGCTLFDDDVGTHLVLELGANRPRSSNDVDLAKRLYSHGINATPLSEYYLSTPKRQGFVLGYGALRKPEMQAALTTFSQVISEDKVWRSSEAIM